MELDPTKVAYKSDLNVANIKIGILEYKAKNQAIKLKSLSERFIVLSQLVEHHCNNVHPSVT